MTRNSISRARRRPAGERRRGRALGAVVGLVALGLAAWALGAGASRAGQGDPGRQALDIPRPEGDPVVQTRPDGAQYVIFRGHYLTYAVARYGAGGRLEQVCLSDPNAVDTFLQSGNADVAAPGSAPPASPAGEEK